MNAAEKQEHIDTGKRKILLLMLYDRKITIEEFKDYCIDNNLDYNDVEHCCGCAGCYEPEENSMCPDWDSEDKPPCKIVDPNFCNICGKRANIGYPLEDNNNKVVYTFWVCDEHFNNKKLEKQLRRGTDVDLIVKKWNK